MKKVIAIAVITILAIFGYTQRVEAYSINLENQTPKEVKPGETFNLTIEADEKTPLANGHIEYNKDLFEFVKSNQENMSAQAYINDGYVSWMYTNTNTSVGVQNYIFTFKAKNVTKTSTGTFKLTDAVFISGNNKTYEGSDIKGKNSVDVTIKVNGTKNNSNNNITNKTNSITSSTKEQGKKDNTTTSDKKLPQTGKSMMIIYFLISVGILAIVLKIKCKKINKLFIYIFLPVLAVTVVTTSVSALKLADTENYQAGLFDSLIKNEKVIAINPGKTYPTTDKLSLEMLQSIFSEQNLTIENIKDKNGKSLENTKKISTGDKVVLKDKSEYTVLLYGDADGNGIFCNSADVNVIRDEYVKGKRAEGVYRLAADLSPDNILNVKDVLLMVKKYTNKQNGPLVIPFPDDDYELPKQKIKDENVLKITSIDTTLNSAKVDISLNRSGLTAKSLTYEIYKIVDGEEPIIQTKHTTLDFSELSHIFNELTENTEYYVIVTLNCDEADYYAEQTITTKNKLTERENIEGILEISKISGNNVTLTVNITKGELKETDEIQFSNNHTNPKEHVTTKSLTHTYQNLTEGTYEFHARILDKETNKVYDIGTISTRIMKAKAINIEKVTTSTIETRIQAPSTITASDTVIWKIEGPNNYKHNYETKLLEDGTFKYTYTGLFENTEYNVWYEVKDENGNLMATSEKQTVKTEREFEIELQLLNKSINKDTGKGNATVRVEAVKGNWTEADRIQYYFLLDEDGASSVYCATTEQKTFTFDNLQLNKKYRLIVEVLVNGDSEKESLHGEVNVIIRNVEVNSFTVDADFTKNTDLNLNEAIATLYTNGVISTDKIVYEIREKDDIVMARYDGENKRINENSESYEYKYENLKLGTTYCFQAKIYDEDWNLLASSNEVEKIVREPIITVSGVPARGNPSTELNCTVTNLNGDKFNMNSYEFILYKRNSDGSYSEVLKKSDNRVANNERAEFTISNLTPNTLYKIAVIAKDQNNNTVKAETTTGTSSYNYTEEEANKIPEIELSVNYTQGADEATATITADNPDTISKYYYKLFKYGNSDALIPVTEQDKWIESNSNTHTFENLEQNTRYLVVVQAKSVRDKYAAEEKSFEFTTNKFKPVINVTGNTTSTHINASISTTAENEATLQNYHFVVIDKEENHTRNNQKAKYIEMPVADRNKNSYTFTGLYPNTAYNLFGQATSNQGIMSNYQNRELHTTIIRDQLTTTIQGNSTDKIKVVASKNNLTNALNEIKDAGIYQLDLNSCKIYYKYTIPGNAEEKTKGYKNANEQNAFEYEYTGLTSGKAYNVWMEIYDKDNKLIWTTKRLIHDPKTGTEIETPVTVEIVAPNIESIIANRRQEESLDIKVKLDGESLTRIKNNAATSYSYEYKLWEGYSAEGNPTKQGTLTYGSNYNNIVRQYDINFANNKYYTSYKDNTTYDGDIFHIDGLKPETHYIIEIIVKDYNGGRTPEDAIGLNNRVNVYTRASKPTINMGWSYKQSIYDSDAMDAKQLYRVGTANIRVGNDAVVDYEYLESSGFNFKLYKAEIINGDATRGELVNSNDQTIRYRYTNDDLPASTDRPETLEKQLAREKAADEHLQTWTYRVENLEANESYILDIKAISRVGVESRIYSKVFKANWETPELIVNLTQPDATKAKLDIENKAKYAVSQYTINVVEAENIKTDDSGTILDFDWKSGGEAIYAKSFGPDNFTDAAKKGKITISDINNLEIDKTYVIIIEAKSTNDSTCTYYELIDTTVIAKVKSTNKMYTSVQDAINDVNQTNETVILMKDVTESAEVPANKSIILDLNDKTLNGADDKIYTLYVLGNLKLKNGRIERTDATNAEDTELRHTIWAANILVDALGNVEVLEGTELDIQARGGIIIANLGSKNIIIDGAILTTSAEGTRAIRDIGTNGNIYIFSGQISGRLIKTNAGSIYIGKDSRVNYGYGLQETILSRNELLIAASFGTIEAGDDTEIYFYNGVLETSGSSGSGSGSVGGATFSTISKNPFTATRSTDNLVGGYDHSYAHYEPITTTSDTTNN